MHAVHLQVTMNFFNGVGTGMGALPLPGKNKF